MDSQYSQFVKSFDEVFKDFDVNNTKQYSAGIDWYNQNLLLISLNVLCPCPKIEVYSIERYQWAYSSGLLATANVRSCLAQREQM